MGRGQELYRHAKTRIPGGTQLLSKRPEMFLPEQWPSYFSRARGAEVWDLDGRRYLDMTHNSAGACILGAADPDVNAAVVAAVEAGTMSTLNCPEEVELADALCELNPWADMVRYARAGGEAMAMAVRIARAHTRRDRVAFCGYHGWHDWYLAANLSEDHALDGHLLPGLEPAGVPRGLTGTALPFRYNRIEELEAIASRYRGELAAVVLEPIRDQEPQHDFLGRARQIAADSGAVFVVDEISSGFRLGPGGAHCLYGLEPDLAVFGKALSNGYPMSAVVGRGGIMQSAQRTFISSTQWTDRVGPVAALATLRKHRRCEVWKHLDRQGGRVQAGWREAGAKAGLTLDVGGIRPLSHFSFPGEKRDAARTLFTQSMLDKGFLAGAGFYPTYAHQDEHVAAYLAAAADVFTVVAAALAEGTVEALLKGPIAHAGFKRLT